MEPSLAPQAGLEQRVKSFAFCGKRKDCRGTAWWGQAGPSNSAEKMARNRDSAFASKVFPSEALGWT